MNIEKWKQNYTGIISCPEKAKKCLNDFKSIIAQKKLILYGANHHGKTLFKLFKDMNIEVNAFIDRNAKNIGSLMGVDVYEPEWLKTINKREDYILLSATNPQNRSSIINDLQKLGSVFTEIEDGYYIHTPLQTALCTFKLSTNENIDISGCPACSIMNHTCPILRKYLTNLRGIDETKEEGALTQTLIGYILGKKCTLKCKHCVELVPYIEKTEKKFTPKDIVIRDIEKIAKSSRFITVLDFVGGEPFLHPDLIDILIHIKQIPNIGIIEVFTNGTVIPSNELCKTLKDERINICLDSYERNISDTLVDNVIKTKDKLKSYGVFHFYSQNMTWFDCHSFDFVDDDEETLKKRFSKCVLANCQRVDNGVMYRCLHHYAGAATGRLSIADETINIHDYGQEELANKLDWFNRLSYINVCRYCKLPFNMEVVQSGVQL